MAETKETDFEIDLRNNGVSRPTSYDALNQPEVKVFYNGDSPRTKKLVETSTYFPEKADYEQNASSEPEGACGFSNDGWTKTILKMIPDQELAAKIIDTERQRRKQEYGECTEPMEGGKAKYVLIGNQFYDFEYARSTLRYYLERKPGSKEQTFDRPVQKRLFYSKSFDNLFSPPGKRFWGRRSVSLADLENYPMTCSENFMSWLEHTTAESTRHQKPASPLTTPLATDDSQERQTTLGFQVDTQEGEFESKFDQSEYPIQSPETVAKPKSLRKRFSRAMRQVFRCFSCCRKPKTDE